MQSEEFDKRVRDAAEHHHPAYDDKAWMKMEQLLDKHMPVEKERKKRFLLILFFFLLLGGGAFIWVGTGNLTGSKKAVSKIPASKEDQRIERTLPGFDANGYRTGTIVPDHDLGKTDKTTSGLNINGQNNDKEKLPENIRIDKIKISVKDNDRYSLIKTKPGSRKSKEASNKKEEQLVLPAKKEDPIAKAIQPDHVNPFNFETRPEEKALTKNTTEKDPSIVFHVGFPAIDSFNLSEISKPSVTRLSHKKGILFLAASIAPDLSVVGLNEMGKVRTAKGFGIGYTKGRITVRSGLYSARKIYEAYPEDYKAPAAFYSRYPNLQEVKADCKVYEIPLLVSYNLSKTGSGHWFVTGGISNYLMKRETYDYYYKWNINGPVVHRQRTIRNANQHYFSVATVSAGYQHALSKKISLIAEPYIKMPLTGIGFGKVKLNSAGILFSVAFKPFTQKK